MSAPVVSVIVPTFNRAALLPRALDSVAAQTFTDWEILLVDDGSTDATPWVAERYRARLGQRLRFIAGAHHGPCRARNRGIEAASGEFVAFLDSDDEFAPEKLERQVALFRRCPELALVYSDYACIDLEGVRFPSVFDSKCRAAREVRATRVGEDEYLCAADLLDVLLRQYFIATITGMVRREVLHPGPRFIDDPAYAEEWLFYAEIVRRHRAGFVDAPLSLHHFTTGSVSRTSAHENMVRLVRTLREMLRRLQPLTREQRATIRLHLANAHSQLAYDAQRCGAIVTALRHRFGAFHHRRVASRLGASHPMPTAVHGVHSVETARRDSEGRSAQSTRTAQIAPPEAELAHV